MTSQESSPSFVNKQTIQVHHTNRAVNKPQARELSNELILQKRVALSLSQNKVKPRYTEEKPASFIPSPLKGEMLPTQVFYNMERNKNRRQLRQIALHQYPGEFTSSISDSNTDQTISQQLIKPQIKTQISQKVFIKSVSQNKTIQQTQFKGLTSQREISAMAGNRPIAGARSLAAIQQSYANAEYTTQPGDKTIEATSSMQKGSLKSLQSLTQQTSVIQNDILKLPKIKDNDLSHYDSLDQLHQNDISFEHFKYNQSVIHKAPSYSGYGERANILIKRQRENSQIMTPIKKTPQTDKKNLKYQLNKIKASQLARQSPSQQSHRSPSRDDSQAKVLNLLQPSLVKDGKPLFHPSYHVKIDTQQYFDKANLLTSVKIITPRHKIPQPAQPPSEVQKNPLSLSSLKQKFHQMTQKTQVEMQVEQQYQERQKDQDENDLQKAIDKKFAKLIPGQQIFDSQQARDLYQIIHRKVEQLEMKDLRNKTHEIDRYDSAQSVSLFDNQRSRAQSIARLDSKKVIGLKGQYDGVSISGSSPSHAYAASSKGVSREQSASLKSIKRKTQFKKQNYEGQDRLDLTAIQNQFQHDLFFHLKESEKPKVFVMLKNLKWDAERRILRSKLVKNQELYFPGIKERFEQTLEKYGEEQIAKRKQELQIEELKNNGNYFAYTKDLDLKAVFKKHSDDNYDRDMQGLQSSFLRQYSRVGNLTMINEEKLQALLKKENREEELVSYIKYLIGEQGNANFKFKRVDFEQKHELNTKSLVLPFDEYAQHEENAMKTVANDIIQRVDYNLVVHHFSDPISIHQQASNPKYAYFRICHSDMEVAIPLLAHVVNKQLCLQNYLLSIGHVKAFVKTFEFNDEFVNKFLFDNCGLTDQHNEILFKEFLKLRNVRDLVLKTSELGVRSMSSLIPVIQRPYPNNLRCLRLINCKIGVQYCRQLISAIRDQNWLQSLALVNANIKDESMLELGSIVQESNYLIDFDISWNKVKTKSYINLIQALQDNRVLKNLNLSWNSLVDEEISETVQTERNWLEQKQNLDPYAQKLVQSLVVLIKRNKQLMHLNLVSTGLTEHMITELAKAMRRSKSLLSVHLCGNKGVTDRVKDFVQTKIRAMPSTPQRTFNVNQVLQKQGNYDASQMLKNQLARGSENKGEKPVARESIKLKQIMERKRIHSKEHRLTEDVDSNSRLICTRFLNFKKDIPGAGQWKVITDKKQNCWVCDQHNYGLIFWDQDQIAGKFFLSTQNPEQESLMRSIVKDMHLQVCPQQVEDEVVSKHPNSPLIFGEFTNWQPFPMTEITQFQERFLPQLDRQEILERLQGQRKIPQSVTLDYMNQRNKDILEQEIENFYKNSRYDWKYVLSTSLMYKKPHLVYAANTRPDYYGKLFVFASFLRVGRHDFIIRTPGQNPEYMYSSTIADIRSEDPPSYCKPSKHKQNVRIFKKENSVFAQWKTDSSKSLKAATQTDFAEWKVDRVIKNEKDYEAVQALILANIKYLKDVFLELQANSSYPFVSTIELSTFCSSCDLFDNNFKTAHNDLLFIATNAVTKGNIRNKTGLIRAEFFEFLIRVCEFKYIKTGQFQTFEDALRYLVFEKIKPNFQLQEWQAFRETQLWTCEVNDVLQENLENIKRVFMFYQKPDHNYMSYKDCMQMMTKDSYLCLTTKQAKYCYGFCKMTNEDEANDFNLTDRIKFVELLEMIGRIADVKYQGTDEDSQPLNLKIENVLDQILPLAGCQRKEVKLKIESASESDDDY